MSMSKNAPITIVRTILDGLKDAEMQLGYAEEAQEAGDEELAHLHMAEAKARLDGVKAWYDKSDAVSHEDAYEAMKDHFMEWYHSMSGRVQH